jgi:NADPH:quinone reductase
MKAIRIFEHGGPEILLITDVVTPEPCAKEVLVRNEAIGVNFVDTQHRAGLYYPVDLPLILGVEAAGVVAAIGPEVREFAVGDPSGMRSTWEAFMRNIRWCQKHAWYLFRQQWMPQGPQLRYFRG